MKYINNKHASQCQFDIVFNDFVAKNIIKCCTVANTKTLRIYLILSSTLSYEGSKNEVNLANLLLFGNFPGSALKI